MSKKEEKKRARGAHHHPLIFAYTGKRRGGEKRREGEGPITRFPSIPTERRRKRKEKASGEKKGHDRCFSIAAIRERGEREKNIYLREGKKLSKNGEGGASISLEKGKGGGAFLFPSQRGEKKGRASQKGGLRRKGKKRHYLLFTGGEKEG